MISYPTFQDLVVKRYAMRLCFDVDIKFSQRFMCENSRKKQEFLKLTNAMGGILIDNAKNLVKPTVINLLDYTKAIVPNVFFLIAGYICADKSPCNNKAKSMRTSMQDKVGMTSETFEMVYAYILIALPMIVVLENVKEMLYCELESGMLSDCVYVCQKLAAAGYGIVTYFLVKAEQFGSGAVRCRIYFLAIRVPLAIADNFDYLMQIKKSMTWPSKLSI